MTQRRLHPLAEEYLRRLQHAGRAIPPERLQELSAEVEDYLSEAIPLGASDREAQQALSRLGSPGEIVEAEQPAGPAPADRRGWREWGAVILLPLGGFVFGVGWLVGLLLLWTSRLWTTRDKLLGTLIVPGGIATVLLVLVLTGTKRRCTHLATRNSTGALLRHAVHCAPSARPSAATTLLQIALLAFVVAGPLISAAYLTRRARARTALTP